MWISSKFGFFSAVCGLDQTKQEEVIQRDTLVVRARFMAHAQELAAQFKKYGTEVKVLKTPSRDYCCRIVLNGNAQISLFWHIIATSITYPNFKDAVREERPEDHDYQTLCHVFWREAFMAQEKSIFWDNTQCEAHYTKPKEKRKNGRRRTF